jgi:protein-S-isoprenylcysteine O-methyltransferase Ste14
MSPYAYLILAAGTLLWVAPFLLAIRTGGSPLMIDKRARWGVALEFVAYTLLWQGSFWLRPLEPWRMAAAALSLALACLLSWTGLRALGKQWRVDAALSQDHQLVKAGPYRIVRHPIYTSMLCLLLGTGLLLATLWMLAIALALFLAGTEIRVRIEDELLASRFGASFAQYKRAVPAYLPFVR